MVICKLSRPSSSNCDIELQLYCLPSVLQSVLDRLSPDELVNTDVKFIKVVE